MAAGYQVWYGYGLVLTDTAVRIEAQGYESLLQMMGFKFVQSMRYCPPIKWGKIMTVAQYMSHKMPSKLLRIDHGTVEALRQWRKNRTTEIRDKTVAIDGMMLPDFASVRKLRCPKCNAPINGFEYVQESPDLRLQAYCQRVGRVHPTLTCSLSLLVDPETMIVTVKNP